MWLLLLLLPVLVVGRLHPTQMCSWVSHHHPHHQLHCCGGCVWGAAPPSVVVSVRHNSSNTRLVLAERTAAAAVTILPALVVVAGVLGRTAQRQRRCFAPSPEQVLMMRWCACLTDGSHTAPPP